MVECSDLPILQVIREACDTIAQEAVKSQTVSHKGIIIEGVFKEPQNLNP